ncbi:MAG: hypothetical protein LBP59_09780 [Planctomycetaceae bacterium]|nr:hypothetical protein [Planctomycetaceae bacterium]
MYIQIVLEFHRFKSVKAYRPKARQAKVNANYSTNSLKDGGVKPKFTWEQFETIGALFVLNFVFRVCATLF